MADEKRQQQIRRKASFALLVYDLHSNMPMGQILDLSARGMKMMTEEPVTINRVYYCRVPLEKKIKGKREVFFDAECRWCQLSEETCWFNSGYILRFPSPTDAEIVQELIRTWMISETSKLSAKYVKPPKEKRGFFRRIFSSG